MPRSKLPRRGCYSELANSSGSKAHGVSPTVRGTCVCVDPFESLLACKSLLAVGFCEKGLARRAEVSDCSTSGKNSRYFCAGTAVRGAAANCRIPRRRRSLIEGVPTP